LLLERETLAESDLRGLFSGLGTASGAARAAG
jgi:hypothetical protein